MNSPIKIDAPEADYLYIETSQLDNAGRGLFTSITIYKDDIISVFKGEILTESQAEARVESNQDQYFINMIDGTIMDSINTECFAKFANDASGFQQKKFRNNAEIGLDNENNVCLIATKNIKSGAEIFCNYGKRYWEKHDSLS